MEGRAARFGIHIGCRGGCDEGGGTEPECGCGGLFCIRGGRGGGEAGEEVMIEGRLCIDGGSVGFLLFCGLLDVVIWFVGGE